MKSNLLFKPPATAVLALGCVFLGACVEDLSPTELSEETDSGSHSDSDSADPGNVTFEFINEQEGVRADVDSSDALNWVYIDLDTPEETDGDGAWSLKFQRYTIAVNGGVSGSGDVEAVFDPDGVYEDVQSAPTDGWITDLPDADEDGKPEYALGEWYDYDASTHVLSPKAGTWFIRGLASQTFALEVVDYYDAAGDSGHPTVRFRPVLDPGR